MSVQYGVWNFDGAQPAQLELEQASRLLTRLGPDAENGYWGKGIAIVYRALHTTKESREESQPSVLESGAVFTWNGRLDNREEIARMLGSTGAKNAADGLIAGKAYERWGISAFARLIGDWTLSIWEPKNRALILARDPLGTRHLYYLADATHVIWSSALDPLVLLRHQPLALNEEYVAGWLSSLPDARLTPYIGVEAVPPACFVRLTPGKRGTQEYWSFDSTIIRYRSDSEYEEHFRVLFAQSVKRRLRSCHPVLAELSGGMDSSAIVCMADQVLAQGGTGTSRLDTVSFYNDSDPNWNERPYFATVAAQRGRAGYQVNVGRQQGYASFPDVAEFMATPACLRQSSYASIAFAECLRSSSARVVLSGIGGDEVMGGIADPIPELADHLRRGHFGTFYSQLMLWALRKRRPWLQLLHAVITAFRSRSVPSAPWLAVAFVRDHREKWYTPGLRLFGPRPSFQCNLRTLEGLRRQLSAFAPADTSPYEKRYPYLDPDLLQFLFSLPPEQLVRPGERRSLMRRALRGIVPQAILDRKRKAAVSERSVAAFFGGTQNLTEIAQDMVGASLNIVDETSFQEALARPEYDPLVPIIPLLRTIGMELWLENLVAHQIVHIPARKGPRSLSCRLPIPTT